MLLTVAGKAEAASSAKFSYKTKDRNTSYGEDKMNAEVSYRMVVLKGKSAAVRKINKAIEKDCKSFLNSRNANDLLNDVSEMNENGVHDNYESIYYYRADSAVTYNRRNVISICVDVEWFAGGVRDTAIYGMTFDLKTGKKLGLKQVCSGTAKQIKSRILKLLEKQQAVEPLILTDVYKYKLADFDFFLRRGNRAMICFDSYELGYLGVRIYKIKSIYK